MYSISIIIIFADNDNKSTFPGDLLGSNLGGTGVGSVNGWSYLEHPLQAVPWGL